MTREYFIQRVKEIMTKNNPWGQYHLQNFATYSSLGEMAPINSNIISNMPSSKIFLSEQVYEMLLAVGDITNETMQEFPFFLYGQENEDNTIFFNEFISASQNRQNASANFNESLLNSLEEKLKSNRNNGFVVCHGHSHPPIGNFHQHFSLGDFASYMQMNQNNSVFKNKQVELTGCLVTSTNDINFLFYDNISNNFYRFTEVFVKSKNGKLIPVNCYGLNQSQQVNEEENRWTQ